MNWPFFTFTTAPVSPAATTRSVCRARNAGIWRTSQTSATGLHCHGSCTSVRTGTLHVARISARIFSPLSIPGPRNESTLVRFALSKLALKTKPTFSFAANATSRFARPMAIARDSMTHGPAMNVSPPSPNTTPLSTRIFLMSEIIPKPPWKCYVARSNTLMGGASE